MSLFNIFDQINTLKDKFNEFLYHRKKLKALENYASVTNFPHASYLGLIKKCIKDGFLGEKESDFLSYMLDTYQLNFLDWSYRTPWIKEQMAALAAERKVPKKHRAAKPSPLVDPRQMDLFEDNPRAQQIASTIPAHLLQAQAKAPRAWRNQ